jgi:hypothetical protein
VGATVHNRSMHQSRDGSARNRPVERFKPTTGLVLGWAGVLLAAVAIGYCALEVHSMVGLRVALGAAAAGVLIWMTQLRPRATAYEESLVLRGSLHDVEVPYLAVEEVSVTQMLNVHAAGRRYVCVGIGKSIVTDIRQRAKKERQATALGGGGRLRQFSEKAEIAAPDQTAMTYQTFVVTRIEELVDQAKRRARDRRDDSVAPVETRLAMPEVVGLAVTSVAFVVACIL